MAARKVEAKAVRRQQMAILDAEINRQAAEIIRRTSPPAPAAMDPETASRYLAGRMRDAEDSKRRLQFQDDLRHARRGR